MTDHREIRDLVEFDRARKVLDSLDLDADTETVPLSGARWRVLAERVAADVDVPGFDRAAMDGYAVRATDTTGADEVSPVSLQICGRVAAGERPEASVDPGTAIEVGTGAALPPGADAVVEVEATSEIESETTSESDGTGDGDGMGDGDGTVEIRRVVAPGEHVGTAGADVAAGDPALAAGVQLTPRTIGLLAALGHDEVLVRRRPRIAVVATGEELVQPGEPLDHERGQIYDVNTATITAGVREAGGDPVRYTRVADDYDELRATVADAAGECDLVLTAGSSSAGSGDMLYRVVEDLGDLLVHGVAIKPGKPTMVGRVGGTPYVGLPGYPVSALSVFRLLVAPRIRTAAGLGDARAPTRQATLAIESRYEGGRRRALSVGLVGDGAGDLLAYPVDKGSGATTSLAYADGVVDVPANTHHLPAGESVTVELFASGVQPPDLLAVGESDPVAARLLDRVGRVRYLPRGSQAGERWLRDDVADVGVVTGDGDRDGTAVDEGTTLASWHREWGVVRPAGEDGTGEEGPGDGDSPLSALVAEDATVATVSRDVGLRAVLDRALDDAGLDPESVVGAETAGIESPARRVADGRAGVGIGLRATAERLGLGFASVGSQPVSLVGNDSRRAKTALGTLGAETGALDEILAELPGYDR